MCTFTSMWLSSLTYKRGRFTFSGMPPARRDRKRFRLAYPSDPFSDESDVPRVTKKLEEWPGGSWTGQHLGQLLDTAAVFAQVDNIEGHQRLTGLLILAEDEPITARDLRKISVEAIENALSLTAHHEAEEELKRRPPLRRESGEAPADFSRKVADYYSAWERIVPNPAAAMAKQYGVKSPTLHAWIREARLRGLLPPAKRRGRRGT
jgi:hypothetical protein